MVDPQVADGVALNKFQEAWSELAPIAPNSVYSAE